jgi:hypothetical protein
LWSKIFWQSSETAVVTSQASSVRYGSCCGRTPRIWSNRSGRLALDSILVTSRRRGEARRSSSPGGAMAIGSGGSILATGCTTAKKALRHKYSRTAASSPRKTGWCLACRSASHAESSCTRVASVRRTPVQTSTRPSEQCQRPGAPRPGVMDGLGGVLIMGGCWQHRCGGMTTTRTPRRYTGAQASRGPASARPHGLTRGVEDSWGGADHPWWLPSVPCVPRVHVSTAMRNRICHPRRRGYLCLAVGWVTRGADGPFYGACAGRRSATLGRSIPLHSMEA